MALEGFIGNLGRVGFFDFMLPFFLFTAIVYGILETKKWISEETSVNGTIAILFSFSMLNYTPLGTYFSTLFGLGAMLLAGILVLGLVAGMLGLEHSDLFFGDKRVMGAVLLIVLIMVFSAAGVPGAREFGRIMDSEMFAAVLFIGGMIAVVSILNKKD